MQIGFRGYHAVPCRAVAQRYPQGVPRDTMRDQNVSHYHSITRRLPGNQQPAPTGLSEASASGDARIHRKNKSQNLGQINLEPKGKKIFLEVFLTPMRK